MIDQYLREKSLLLTISIFTEQELKYWSWKLCYYCMISALTNDVKIFLPNDTLIN